NFASERPQRVDSQAQLSGKRFKGMLPIADDSKIGNIKRLFYRKFNSLEHRVCVNGFIISAARTTACKLLGSLKVFWISALLTGIACLPLQVFQKPVTSQRIRI